MATLVLDELPKEIRQRLENSLPSKPETRVEATATPITRAPLQPAEADENTKKTRYTVAVAAG